MKKFFTVFFAVLFCGIFLSCESTKVERVSADTQTDLSGYWNDTDVRIVAQDLTNQLINADWYTNFIKENQKKPVVIVGTFRNKSDEHMDTTIISKKLEFSLINTGKVTSVANASERQEIRDERDDQQINSSLETAKNLGSEIAADIMLQDNIKTIVDSNGKTTTRTYYVSAELVDLEKNTKIWLGENSSIKKIITRSSAKF